MPLNQPRSIRPQPTKYPQTPNIPNRSPHPTIPKIPTDHQPRVRDTQRQQRRHRVMQRFTVPAVELCDDEEDEGEGHVFEEVGV